MTARQWGALVAAAGLVTTVPLTATAGPIENYNVSDTTRCANGNGCPRMRSNAVSRARRFCATEGGVKSGGSKLEFRCEQRGLNCVVTGKIECHGRIDPTTGERAGGAGSLDPRLRRPRTCLDAACSRYVDHGVESIEDAVQRCAAGDAMVGLSWLADDIVCERRAGMLREARLERDPATRSGQRACPKGWLMIGVAVDRAGMMCARFDPLARAERVQSESDELGLHVCEAASGRSRYMVGLSDDRTSLLCAD